METKTGNDFDSNTSVDFLSSSDKGRGKEQLSTHDGIKEEKSCNPRMTPVSKSGDNDNKDESNMQNVADRKILNIGKYKTMELL